MILLNTIKKGFALFFMLSIYVQAMTLDEAIEKRDAKLLVDYVKSIEVYYSIDAFPDNPKAHDLAIIEDDYNVQIVFEFKDDIWNERTDLVLAKILNANEKLGFGHLFGFKLDEREFNAYNTDTQSIFVEILPSNFVQENVSKQINDFINTKNIKMENIVNIQIDRLNAKKSQIIVIYKY